MKHIKMWVLMSVLLMMMAGFSQAVYAHDHHETTKGTTDSRIINLKTALTPFLVDDSGALNGESFNTAGPEPSKLSGLIEKERHERALSTAIKAFFGNLLLFEAEIPNCPVCGCDHQSHPNQCDTPCTEVGNHYCNV